MKFIVEIPDPIMTQTAFRAKGEGMTGTAAEILQYELVNSLTPESSDDQEIQRMYRLVTVTQVVP